MPLDFYNAELSQVRELLLKEKPKEKIYILLRIVCFLSFALGLYLYFNKGYTWSIYFAVASLLFYVLTSWFDTKHSNLMKLLACRISFIEQEIAYLNNSMDSLEEGKSYIDPQHEYVYDLDIFGRKSLFQAVNRTVTQEGRDTLALWMKTPKVEENIILNRQAGVNELASKTAWRIGYQSIGKFGDLSAKYLLSAMETIKTFSGGKLPAFIYYLAYAISITGFLILIAIFSGYLSGQLFATIFILQLIIAYSFAGRLQKIADKLNPIERNLSLYVNLLKHLETLEVSSPYLADLHNKFSADSNLLNAFRELKGITAVLDRRANLIGSLIVNGFFINDLHLIRRYQKWVTNYSDVFSGSIAALSEFDALCSIANFKFNHPEFTFPILDSTSILNAKNLAHPLIPAERRVANDFEIKGVHQFFIITGANMAGKSTFLRTVGVNMVLASCGAPVCATKFVYKPIPIFSSMRTADNLADDTSFFRAELNRLQKLLDCVKRNELTFIILDEILKGTNSVDKLNGSRLFLKRLLSMPVSGLIATHDLALSELEKEHPGSFENICFEICDGESISYTYKLLPGVTQKLNATRLIEEMLLKW